MEYQSLEEFDKLTLQPSEAAMEEAKTLYAMSNPLPSNFSANTDLVDFVSEAKKLNYFKVSEAVVLLKPLEDVKGLSNLEHCEAILYSILLLIIQNCQTIEV